MYDLHMQLLRRKGQCGLRKMRDIRELKYLQTLPLEQKIEMTAERVDGWYDYYDGKVAVSFSGGKDSTVLLDISRNHWRGHKDIKAVYVDTGLEYPEIRQFVKTFDNIEIIRPKMRFDEVIKKYGYPVISKVVSHNVRCARNKPHGDIVKNCFCKEKTGPYAMAKWNGLRFVDFNIDDRCCDIMKKQPAHEYSKRNGVYFITAEMASESKKRTENWLHHGCNGFDLKTPKSTPMAFWTEQDVLEYIYKNKLPIAEPYGNVVETECQLTFDHEHCKYATTGCDRTGCMFCAFGAHLEKGETRFQRLKKTHPKQYAYCVSGGELVDGIWQPNKQGLGMRHVFNKLNELYGDNFIRF